ncbi:hypothetical protein KL938_000622 [Ogataea parapolymorpha]|nr:hypothetical protein KL938_000622 [Ogataea parapolymorpha]
MGESRHGIIYIRNYDRANVPPQRRLGVSTCNVPRGWYILEVADVPARSCNSRSGKKSRVLFIRRSESCVLMRTSWVPCSGIAIITPPSGERGFSSQMFVAEVTDPTACPTACPTASPQPFNHTTCPSIAPICSLDNSCAT